MAYASKNFDSGIFKAKKNVALVRTSEKPSKLEVSSQNAIVDNAPHLSSIKHAPKLPVILNYNYAAGYVWAELDLPLERIVQIEVLGAQVVSPQLGGSNYAGPIVWKLQPREPISFYLCTNIGGCSQAIVLPNAGLLCAPFTIYRNRGGDARLRNLAVQLFDTTGAAALTYTTATLWLHVSMLHWRS